MPKEGPFAFDYCGVGEPQVLTGGDKGTGGKYTAPYGTGKYAGMEDTTR